MTYTILRPGYFMEAWLSPMVGFDAANAKATIYGSGDQPISWISITDVIQFAVESVSNPAARNAVLELGGPQKVSPNEVIKFFEKKAGKSFEVSYVPVEALKDQMETATEPMQKSFVGLMYCYALGDPIDMKGTVQAFPIKLVSIQEYVEKI
jgi:nucleoside-diphosphate-sugar epimerase